MNRQTLNKLIVPFMAAGAVCFGVAAQAAETDGSASSTQTPTTPQITHAEAKDLRTQSDAEYKARKKVAEANREPNKAECKTELEGGTERACKKSAKIEAKQDKANAKMIHESEKADIKAKAQ